MLILCADVNQNTDRSTVGKKTPYYLSLGSTYLDLENVATCTCTRYDIHSISTYRNGFIKLKSQYLKHE